MKFLLLLFLFPFTLSAQEGKYRSSIPTPYDTVTHFKFRLNAGTLSIIPTQTAKCRSGDYLYDWNRIGLKTKQVFYNTYGVIVSNSFLLDLRENPITPVIDISLGTGAFRMNVYDSTWKEVATTMFKNIHTLDIGIGAEIEGRVLFAGLYYAFGWRHRGKMSDPIPMTPMAVKDGRINFPVNNYGGIQLSFGVKIKKFNVRIKGSIPMSQHQIRMDNYYPTGISNRMVEAGYTWNL